MCLFIKEIGQKVLSNSLESKSGLHSKCFFIRQQTLIYMIDLLVTNDVMISLTEIIIDM